MKLSFATATLLLAGLAVAAPQNRNNGNRNGGNTNANSGNTNSNSGNTNSNSGNTNSNSGNNNAGNQTTNGGNNNVDQPQVQDGSNDRSPFGSVDQQTAQLMQTSIDAWMRDTGVVSNFLNIGPNIQDEATFRNQAQIAHSAEVDELTQKAVLDQFMPNNQNVKAANATLSNGAFQLVVDRLDDMARQGFAQKNGIDDINKDRCVNVLPNIDAYMREAALTIGNGQGIQQSVRPAACSNVVAGQNGALKVNQPPPNYVNGKLQNGNSNTNPNIAATPADDDQPEILLSAGGNTQNANGQQGNNGNNNNNNNNNN